MHVIGTTDSRNQDGAGSTIKMPDGDNEEIAIFKKPCEITSVNQINFGDDIVR